MPRRSSNNKSGAGMIVALVVALSSLAVLAWLPIRKGSALCQFVGGLAIAGGVAAIVWYLFEYKAPPDGLRLLASASGVGYGTAVALRLWGVFVPPSHGHDEGTSRSLPSAGMSGLATRRGEVVLFQDGATLMGERTVRAFGGISSRLGLGLRAGGGLSLPISVTDAIDHGTFFVTNERIILIGAKRSITLRPSQVVSTSIEANRMTIHPSNGRTVVLELRQADLADGAIRDAMQLAR